MVLYYLDLETTIKTHLESDRKRIHPNNNPILNEYVELQIKIIEKRQEIESHLKIE